jgi:hypothetical protein
VLPWDQEIFQFPVAEYWPGPLREWGQARSLVRQRLAEWAKEQEVELICSRSKADETALGAALQELGFRYVETSLCAALPHLDRNKLPERRITTRTPEPSEHPALLRIAGSAFRHGRYHADFRFPRTLANRRYEWWLGEALQHPTAGTRVYVVGSSPRPLGFLHVEVAGPTADLRLGAVDPDSETGIAGFHLYLGVLHELAALGVGRVVARISAANVSMVNLYSELGFRFAQPESVLHWHREPSRFLRSLDEAV